MKDHDTKQRIIDAGTKAIVEKSFNGVGLKEILDAAGVPKGSFYHYFKSKEHFGIAVVEDSSEHHLSFTRKLFADQDKTPMERIRAYFIEVRDHLQELGSQRQCLIAKVALEESRLSEPMRNAIKVGYDQWQVLLAGVIRLAQAEGEIASDLDADELAAFLQNSWEGAMVRMEIDRDCKALDAFISLVLDRMLSIQAATA
ncbi:MAG: TetR family transcriptional regulator C-terminal domain-containing protein [Planctomycetota bacterium]